MRRLRSLNLLRQQLLEPLYLLCLPSRHFLLALECLLLPKGSLLLPSAGSLFLSQGGLRLLLNHANKRGHLLPQLADVARLGALPRLELCQMCLPSLWHRYLHTTTNVSPNLITRTLCKIECRII